MFNKILLVVIIILLPISIYIVVNKQVVINNKELKVLLNYKDNIKELSLNDYLIGVVGAEMPATFNLEALKAQAIASRSYLLSKDELITNTTEQAYLTNEELKNKWQDNYDKYYEKIKEAVIDTDNLVMTYNNKVIKSYYYSMTNGYTEDSINVFNESAPYYQVIDSTFDQETKNYEYQISYTKEEFCKKLNIDCNIIEINNINRNKSNRIDTITINKKEFKGIDIRKQLNLRSTDFTIEIKDNIIITTKGYGHGVGMSQYGANYLANNNKKYDEILKYYYKDIEIVNYNV